MIESPAPADEHTFIHQLCKHPVEAQVAIDDAIAGATATTCVSALPVDAYETPSLGNSLRSTAKND